MIGRPPWWTAADEAELALVAEALVEAAFIHRERCQACHEAGTSCPALRDAIAVAVGWAQRRHRLSRAAFLVEAELDRVAALRARAEAVLTGGGLR